MKSAAVLNLTLLAAMQCTAATAQQVSSDELNKSNNPLNPAITLNFHNYYYPPTSGPVSVDGNAFWLRGMVPAMIFDTPNLFRFSMPYIAEPAGTPAPSTKLRRKRPPPEKHTFR